MEAGLVYRNPTSRWASPPVVVKKPGAGKFRMTVDVKAVNAQTETLHWPMPIIEVILEYLRKAKVFCGLDFFIGFCNNRCIQRAKNSTHFKPTEAFIHPHEC